MLQVLVEGAFVRYFASSPRGHARIVEWESSFDAPRYYLLTSLACFTVNRAVSPLRRHKGGPSY